MIGDLCHDSAEAKRGIESAELGRADEGIERSALSPEGNFPRLHTLRSSPCNNSGSMWQSAALAATEWTWPSLLSTPMCAFNPKW